MTKPRIIAVLGMHRSGTSTMARGLKALGVELGDNLMPAAEGDNEKGFWEDLDLFRFNERLLTKAGNGWNHLSLIEASRLVRDDYAAERFEAATLVEQKLGGARTFGFKDPRTSVLLPFWRCVFEDLGIEDSYVIALRNPLEVAASLRKRNQLHTEHSLALWLKYTWSAVQYSLDRKRVCVAYNHLMDDPATELSRIASALDLPMPSHSSSEFSEYTEEFLTTSLRHNRISANELHRSSTLPKVITDYYDHLMGWARAAPDEPFSLPTKLRSQIEAFWASGSILLSLSDQLKSDNAISSAKLATVTIARDELADKVEHLNGSKAELERRNSEIQNHASFQATAIADRENRIAEAEAQIGLLTNACHQAQEQFEAATNSIAGYAARISELEAALIALENSRARVQSELDAKAAELALLTAALSDHEKAGMDAEHILATTRHDVHSLSHENGSLKAELAQKTEELRLLREEYSAHESSQQIQAKAADLEAALAQTRHELAEANANLTATANALSSHAATVSENESLKTDLAAKTKELRLLRNEYAEHRQETASAKIKAAAREADLASMATEISTLREELERSHMAARATIGDLETNARRIAAELAGADRMAHDDKIKELSSRILALEAQLSGSQAELSASKIEAESIHRTVVEMHQDLGEKIRTIRLLRHEALEFRSSTSWRITKPLRIARSLLTQPKQVFSHLRGAAKIRSPGPRE